MQLRRAPEHTTVVNAADAQTPKWGSVVGSDGAAPNLQAAPGMSTGENEGAL